MSKKEFLTEEIYQNGKKKLLKIALVVLIVGIILGGSLIVTGIIKQNEVNFKYSEESKLNKKDLLEKEKQDILEQLETEKQNLLSARSSLEIKIKPVKDEIKKLERQPFTGFNEAYYQRQDKIEELEKSIEKDEDSINVINDALDEGFNHCNFSEAKNNQYTSKYCSLKKKLNEKTFEINNIDNDFSEFNKNFDSHDSIPFYILGIFVIIATGMISGSIFMFAKRREILAFTTQQVMPVAQEGIEKMSPTIGKAGASIAKEMAPVYGNIAKEISKGIKEGLKKDDEEK